MAGTRRETQHTAHSTIPQVTPGSWEPSTFLETGVRARATDLQEGQEWRNLKAPSKQKEKRPMQQRQQSQPVGETDLSTDVCTWGRGEEGEKAGT